MNLGCSGMSSSELRQYLEQQEIKSIWQQATDITITIGGNDLIRTFNEKGNKWNFFVTIQKLKWNLQHIFHIIKQHNPSVHVLIMGLYNPGRPEHQLYHRCDSLIRRVNAIYACLSEKYNVNFIDPYDHFKLRPHLLADEIHPNDNGYRKMSELFLMKRQQLKCQTYHTQSVVP